VNSALQVLAAVTVGEGAIVMAIYIGKQAWTGYRLLRRSASGRVLERAEPGFMVGAERGQL
jgi:hypothetical protein